MLIPIRTDNRLRIRPTVNYAIIIANIAVFLLQFLNHGQYDGLFQAYKLNPTAPHLYQFFTYMFLHAGWSHLLGNMLFLWVFGNAINDRFGHVAYAAFYLGAGVLSGVGYILLSGHAPVVGASGAISGVTGCFLVLFPRVRITVLLIFVWIMPLEISSLVFLGFQFLFNIWASVGQADGGVAYAAHSAGYVYGIVLSGGLLYLGVLPRDVYDLLSLIKTWRRRRNYQRMVHQGYDPFSSGPPRTMRRDAGVPTARPAPARQAPPVNEGQNPAAAACRGRIAEYHRAGNLGSAADEYLRLLGLEEDPVLPLQQQLDISNKLMSDQRYPQACESYQRLLKCYPGYAEVGDIRLMLGILYGRYLHQRDQARENLELAVQSLSDPTKLQMARTELQGLL